MERVRIVTSQSPSYKGITKDPMYTTWANMIHRCYNPDRPKYRAYGARGIMVCDRWLDFANFKEDMGRKPDGYSIERKDVNLDYNPENCCWIPVKHQAKNRRSSHVLTMPDGRNLCLADAAREIGINEASLRHRIERRGSAFGTRKWVKQPKP